MPDTGHLLAFAPAALAVILVSVALNTLADVVIAFAAGPLGRRLATSAKWWRRRRRATGTVLIGLGVSAATAGPHTRRAPM